MTNFLGVFLQPELQAPFWDKQKGKLTSAAFSQVAQAVKALQLADAAIDRDLFSIAKLSLPDVLVARLALVDAETKRSIRNALDNAGALGRLATKIEGDLKKNKAAHKPALLAAGALRSESAAYGARLLKNAQNVRDELQSRLDAAQGSQQKKADEAAKAKPAAAAPGAAGGQTEDDPEHAKLVKLVRGRTVPALRQVKAALPDQPAPRFMAAISPQHAAVMVAKSVSASTKGLLAKLLPGEKGLKYFHGEVLWEHKCFTFVSEGAPSGAARKLQKALLALTKAKMKVRVRKPEGEAEEEEGDDPIERVTDDDAPPTADAASVPGAKALPKSALDDAQLAKAIAAAAAKAAGVAGGAMKAEIAGSLRCAEAERKKAEGMVDPGEKARTLAKSFDNIKQAWAQLKKADQARPGAAGPAAPDGGANAATAKPGVTAPAAVATASGATGPAAGAAKPKDPTADNGKLKVSTKAGRFQGPGKQGGELGAEAAQSYVGASGSTAKRSLAFGGKLWFEVTPVADTSPQKYSLKGCLNVSLKLSGSGDNKGLGVGIKASVGAEADYSFSHEFLLPQLTKYMAAVKGQQGGWKEFDAAKLMLAGKLTEARQLLGMATSGAGRAASLKDFAEGDSTETKLTASADGQVSTMPDLGVARVGIAIGASVQGSLARTVAFSKGVYTISMKAVKSDSQRIAGALEVQGAGLTGSKAVENHDSDEIKFEIPAANPQREVYFKQIMAAKSLKDMAALRTQLKGLYSVKIRTQGERDSTAMGATAGVGKVKAGLRGSASSAYSESVVEGSDDGVAKAFAGSSQMKMEALGDGQTAAEVGTTQQFVGGSGSDGKGFGETQATERATDYGATFGKLKDNAKKKGVLRAAREAFKTEAKVLQDKVQTEGAVLSDDSFSLLMQQAQQGGSTWARACDVEGADASTMKAWAAARPAVAAAAELPAAEGRAAVAKALAQFQRVIAKGTTDTLRKAAGDTASGYEFPTRLANKKALYDSLVIKDPLPAALAAGDPAAVATKLADVIKQLTQLGADLSAQSGEFKRQADLDDMLQRVDQRKHQVREAAAKADPKSDQAAAAKAEKLAQIKEVAQRMLQFRMSEARLFKAMEDEFKGVEVFGRNMPKLGAVDVVALARHEKQLKDLYPRWERDLDQMTGLLKASGGDLGKIDPFKPNRKRFKELDAMIPGRSQGAGLEGYGQRA